MNVLQNYSSEQGMGASEEDLILSRVFKRLKDKLDFTLEEVYRATDIPPSSLCDLSGGSSQRYMSRIVKLSKYFREVHGLDYVSTDYLLTGTEDDREALKKELEQKKRELELVRAEQESNISFMEYLLEEEKKKNKSA